MILSQMRGPSVTLAGRMLLIHYPAEPIHPSDSGVPLAKETEP